MAGLTYAYPPRVGNARGTDTVRKEDGGDPPWRQHGPASPCRSCEGAGRISSYSAGRAGLLVPPVPEQRGRHRHGEEGGQGPSSVAARWAGITLSQLRRGGAHLLVQRW